MTNLNTSQHITGNNKFAIRFGLGAIKAVGLKMMEGAVDERKNNGNFSDVFDFCKRLDPKTINKKSIEALAKSGSFDVFKNERSQIAESFDILSAYASQVNEAKNSNQMSLFGSINDSIPKPQLKKVQAWSKFEKLQKEFESFGFFLNEHPLDDSLSDLKKRGVIFSNMIEETELQDNSIAKFAGVILASKHRSSARGRFAYMTICDPFGIYEATIFDEALITNSRDLLNDGSNVVIECLIRKDEGGTRVMIKSVTNINDFIKQVKASDQDFADIKKLPNRKNNFDKNSATNNSKEFKNKESNNNFSNNTKQYSTKTVSDKITKEPQNSSSLKTEKKVIELTLTIADKSIINPLKIILEQKIVNDQQGDNKVATSNTDQSNNNSIEQNDMPTNSQINTQNHRTKIFIIARQSSNNDVKIALPDKYLIKEIDIIRLKNFSKFLSVEAKFGQ
ncbi:MAG: hypothetical protein ACKO47_04600 [Alphaproteobacteria bacterium]